MLNWLPGRKRRGELDLMIRELAESARREPTLQDLRTAQAALWAVFCDGAEDVVRQLVVKKANKRMDWGLKGRRRRIDQTRLLTMYWWMLLYHITLFRHCRVEGPQAHADLSALENAADEFLKRQVGGISPIMEVPRPWEERWNRQFTLEAAMGIYNAVYELLGLFNDLTKRVERVSNFTTATEQGFDERIKTLLD